MVAILNNKRVRSNKGYSLVDLMIAIAVLAILITPIILHVMMTIQTSAQAKEKQYTVDSATSVMEYFKQSSIDDIKMNKNVTGLVNVSTSSSSQITCKIFVNGVDSGKTVKYNCTDFVLDDVELGRAKHQYDRAVVMTDLANKLLAAGYRINYAVDDESSPAYSSDTYDKISHNSAFQIQSDHSAVIFDDNSSLTRHITAVDCVTATNPDYVDPNSVSLGNIQDLDSDKIAIIEGDETRLDHRFESDLVAKILDYASRNSGLIDEDLFSDTAKLNEYIIDLIRDTDNTFSRLIMISNTMRETPGGEKYYHVDVKVRYYLSFARSQFKVFNGSNAGDLTYTVMNRDFYTNEAPDIFMVYEPFIINSNSTDSEYAYKDYITVQSDPYTSGKIDGYDPAKIYLVKPEKSWQAVSGADNGLSGYTGVELEKRQNVYYTLGESGDYVPVEVVINQHFNSVDMGNGSNVTYTDDDCLPLQIITNIASYKDSTDNKWKIFDGQFETAEASSDYPKIKTSSGEGRRAKYPDTISSIKDADGNDAKSIVCPQNETNIDGKVYNITVMYESPSGDLTYLTGAKGVD